jgi:hypothetical protein
MGAITAPWIILIHRFTYGKYACPVIGRNPLANDLSKYISPLSRRGGYHYSPAD